MTERIDQRIQNEIKESAYRIWLAGLGALTTAEEEGREFFKKLVEKGESFQSRAGENVGNVKEVFGSAKGKAGDIFEKFESVLNDRIAAVLGRLGVPTRDEIQDLNNRVEALMEAIQKMNASEKKDA